MQKGVEETLGTLYSLDMWVGRKIQLSELF